MDFPDYSDVTFLPNSSIGELCEDLNTIVGQGIWYDTFQVQITEWLWPVNYIVTTSNSDDVLCDTFGIYRSYAAGILNSVKQMNFYVLSHKHKLSWTYWKLYWGKECNFKLLAENNSLLISGCDTVLISFEAILIHGRLPLGLIFAQSALKRIRLSSRIKNA